MSGSLSLNAVAQLENATAAIREKTTSVSISILGFGYAARIAVAPLAILRVLSMVSPSWLVVRTDERITLAVVARDVHLIGHA